MRAWLSICLITLCIVSTGSAALPTPMELGRPVAGSVPKGQFKVYSVQDITFALHGTTDYWISLMPFAGDADIYVGSSSTIDPSNPSSYQFSSSAAGGDSVLINDNFNRTTIYVAVSGFTNANYTLTVARRVNDDQDISRNTIIDLVAGVPQLAHLDQESEDRAFFSFQVGPRYRGNLTISTTPSSFYDYICVSKSSQYPVLWESCEYSSTSFQYWEPLRIEVEESDTDTMYYIAVSSNGWSEDNFTITATTDNEVTILPEYYAVGGVVKKNEYLYYDFYVNTESAVSFELVSLDGDCDIYVSRTVERPSSSHYTWASSKVDNDIITVLPSDEHFGTGFYYIAIKGYSEEDNYFYLRAVMENGTSILEGNVQETGTIAEDNGYSYYKVFFGDIEHSDLNITAVPLSEGVSTYLYVSSVVPMPSSDPNKHDEKSENEGANSIAIQHHFDNPSWYYIAVKAHGGPAEFHIVANFTQEAMEVSTTRSRYWVYSPRGYYRYFYYKHIEGSEFTLTIDPMYGDPDVYVSHGGSTLVNDTSLYPSRRNFEYTSTTVGADSVTVKNATNGDYYYIAVYAFSQSSYDVLVVSAEGPTTLGDGVPVYASIRYGEYAYYEYTVPKGTEKDLVLELECTAGNADIFVSDTSNVMRPTEATAKFAEDTWAADKSLDIPHSSASTYYIGLYSSSWNNYANCTFTASTTKFWLRLDDPPALYTVAAGATEYFEIADIGNADTGVVVVLSLLNGRTSLFASDTTASPGPSDSKWSSSAYPGHYVIIPHSEFNQSSPLTIGVAAAAHCLGGSTCTDARFTLTARVHEPTEMAWFLQEDMPQLGNISSAGSYDFFRSSVWIKGNYSIRADVRSGSVGGIFASVDNCNAPTDRWPQHGSSTWEAVPTNDEDYVQLIIDNYTKHNYFSCLFISVLAAGNDTSYILQAHEYTAPEASHWGQEQAIVALAEFGSIQEELENMSYYDFYTDSTVANAYVEVDLCSNHHPNLSPAIYAAQTPYVNSTTAQFNATQFSGNYTTRLTFRPNHSGVWYIGVNNTAGATFSVRARNIGNVDPSLVVGGAGLVTLVNNSLSADSESYEVKFTTAIDGRGSTLRYSVYVAPYNPTTIPAHPVNMYTACGCESNSKFYAHVNTTMAPLLNVVRNNVGSGSNITTRVSLLRRSSESIYLVNIVARNEFGDAVAYKPIVVSVAASAHGGGTSGAAVFFILLFVGLILYFVGGFTYNRFRNGIEGWDAIPNHAFWRKVVSLEYCGRKSDDAYATFDDSAVRSRYQPNPGYGSTM